MPFINLDEIEEREPSPGFNVRFIHSENMTLAYWKIKMGAQLPAHSHPHEQVTNVIEGKFELNVEGETRTLSTGLVAVIPSDMVHSEKALTECQIIDVFYPVRKDYL